MARKRQRARDAGLCYECCKQKPNPGRTVCVPCRRVKVESKRRRRQRAREAASLQHIVAAHETAGDKACEHHLYADAAQHYQDALNAEAITSKHESHVAEKLGYALSLGGDPDAANPWFDRALSAYLVSPAQPAKAVEILLQRSRLLWLDARTEAALPLLEQAIHIAEKDGDPRLRKMANGRMANYLLGLSRYKEAESFFRAIGGVTESDDAATRSTYYTQRAILAAAFGNADEVYDYFERAVSAAKEDVDVVNVMNVWRVYGTWAGILGNTELAKTCAGTRFTGIAPISYRDGRFRIVVSDIRAFFSTSGSMERHMSICSMRFPMTLIRRTWICSL